MAVRIRTSDGSPYIVDGSIDDLQTMVTEAIVAKAQFIRVKNGNGHIRSINPRLIASLEELGDDLTPGEAEVIAAAREADPQRGPDPAGVSDALRRLHEGRPGPARDEDRPPQSLFPMTPAARAALRMSQGKK